MEILGFILILFAVVAFAGVYTVGWMCWKTTAFAFRGGRSICRAFAGTRPPPMPATCENKLCGCRNAPAARFCRRCGRTLPGVFNVTAMGRAASL